MALRNYRARLDSAILYVTWVGGGATIRQGIVGYLYFHIPIAIFRRPHSFFSPAGLHGLSPLTGPVHINK